MAQKIKALRIKWNGKNPRTFSLPIPFISHSEKTGEVICNPTGEFPPEDGQRLLDIEGTRAELVETVYEGKEVTEEDGPKITVPKIDILKALFDPCQCGCGKSVAKQGNRFILGHSSQFPKVPTQQVSEAGADPM
ncbi:MAG: hypothetical protein U1E51_22980 [Candidatus Binatia bacterium]|nr:hypothetical protein [Candidatus Binatia bacterium]